MNASLNPACTCASGWLRGARTRWLGRIPFGTALAANAAAEAVVAETGCAELLLFEPAEPIFTLGRRAHLPAGRAALAATIAQCATQRIAVEPAPRGGLGTLHAPGQLVAFVAVRCERTGLAGLAAELLFAAAELARSYGCAAEVRSGADAGVWFAGGKFASLGLHEAHGVAGHGIALNVATEPSAGAGLALCGSAATTYAALTTATSAAHRSALVAAHGSQYAVQLGAGRALELPQLRP
ncbi:MAG: hypothetical protein EXR79_02030 [Myxococcales bacterium]|nr:hypothetical protein [Myxococcales bacterium]